MVIVEQADSKEKLKACMNAIVNALFSRDSDAIVRRSFLASIKEIFAKGGGNLSPLKAKINLLLGRIMYDREERAQLYAKQLAKSQNGETEQRLKEDDPLQVLKDL